jgi:hypothetical protein
MFEREVGPHSFVSIRLNLINVLSRRCDTNESAVSRPKCNTVRTWQGQAISAFGLSGVLSSRSQTRSSASGFQRAELGDHLVPRLDGFGDRGGLVLAVQRNCGTELPADGTDHAQDDFVTPIRSPACAATHIGFGAAGAMTLSHNAG